MQIALEYKQWRRFCNVIDKAKTACEGSRNTVSDHFADVGKMVNIGSGAERELDDIQLSSYACYLIVQNGDPRKKVIALGQSYFAIKTRQQELIENFDELTEDQKRLAIRREMAEHNKMLVAAAKDAGVETSLDYAIFQNYGYMGLYGGMKAQDIKQHNGLKKSQNILDHMGYEEKPLRISAAPCLKIFRLPQRAFNRSNVSNATIFQNCRRDVDMYNLLKSVTFAHTKNGGFP